MQRDEYEWIWRDLAQRDPALADRVDILLRAAVRPPRFGAAVIVGRHDAEPARPLAVPAVRADGGL
jgi:hypothetical protein